MTFKSVFMLVAMLAFGMLFWGLRCGVLPTYFSAPLMRVHEPRAFRFTALVYVLVGLVSLVAALAI